MSIAVGASLGPYEIVRLIGSGGMGEVYLARDNRLRRNVALKVLPAEFASDADRLRRFTQEAHLTAALNHPNVVSVYDVGQASGTTYLVSELLDGSTLRDHLHEGQPWRIRRTLDTVTQIARGLAAAHARGIVHRDLKPENVFVTADGQVKILDFGIAKLRAPAAVPGASGMTTTATQVGLVLGTPGYMAPEQLRGLDVDARADIFAFGAIVYEMLAGRRAFIGATPADTQTAVLTAEPPDLPPALGVPAPLDRGIRRCLAKNPDDRFQSARDLLFYLESESGTQTRDDASSLPGRMGRSNRLLWAGLGLAGAVVVAAAVMWWPTVRTAAPTVQRPAAPVVRFQLTLPSGLRLVPEQPPALSFDGTRLALVALDQESNRRQVYLRLLNSLSTQPLTGTVDAQYPFWSPDGRRLAFFANGSLRVLELESGQIQDLAPAPNAAGAGLWLNDRIVFARSTGPVVRVPVAGGLPQNAAPFDASRETNQSVVGALADGRLVVSSQAGIFVTAADGTSSQRIDSMAAMPALLARAGDDAVNADALLFTQNGRLVVQRFEASTPQLMGEPLQLGHDASGLLARTAVPFVATAEVLAFISRLDIETRPTWVDRSGKVIGRATSVTGQIRDLRLSPDGTRLALSRFAAERPGFELLLVDLRRDTVTRTAPGWSLVIQPAWAPDGNSIVAVGQRGTGSRSVIRIPAVEGAAVEELLRPTAAVPSSADVSADGRWLAFSQTGNDGNFDLYVKPLTSDGAPEAMFSTPAYESGGRLSPDGKWLAYHSSETGPLNVFIRSFPDGRVKQQVSLTGGQKPVWRADGRELFYIGAEGDLIAVSMKLAPTLEVGERRVLFRAPMDVSAGTPGSLLYDVAPDGQRFLITLPTSDVPQPITVIFNWRSLLTPLVTPASR